MDSRKRQCCVIVAGMHRSGTSALTRVVNLLGADISRNLMPAVEGNNDRGFWEPASIVNIHDGLLAELGSAWHDPLPLPEGWLGSDAALRARRSIAEELKSDFGNSSVFVLKDPRVPRFLPLWLGLLDELEIEPIVVITVRNPLEVAGSLEKRDGFSLSRSLLLYIQSNLDAEVFSRGRTRFFASYEDLLEDWRPFSKAIAEMTGIVAAPGADTLINEYLSRQLRHNRFGRAELVARKDVAPLVVEMFDCMQDLVAGRCVDVHGSFDRFGRSFSESLALFGELFQSERQIAADKLAELAARCADVEGALKSENSVLRGEVETAGQRSAELGTLTLDLERSRSRGDQLETENRSALIKIQQLILDNAELSGRTIELEESLRKKTEIVAKAELHTAEFASVLDQKNAEIAELNRALRDRIYKINDLESRCELQRHQLNEIKDSLTRRLETSLERHRNRSPPGS